MVVWELVASSGRNKLSGFFERRSHNGAGNAIIVANITIAGEFWRRDSQKYGNELHADFEVRLLQVILTASLVDDFVERLEQLADSPTEISVDLADKYDNDQSFSLSFGPSEKAISTKDKPVATIRYAGTAFGYGEWWFVVDQSCIRIFVEGLRKGLQAFSYN